jgi:hypothetical protein
MRAFSCNIKGEHIKNENNTSSGKFINGKGSIFVNYLKFVKIMDFSWFVGVPESRERVKFSQKS